MLASELADRIDLSEAMVSRIASGEREPSIETMAKIRTALAWSIERQLDAKFAGKYADEFKQRMERSRARTRT